MQYRALFLAISLLTLLPADALARAGGGSRSFRAPSSGGGYGSRGYGRGGGGLFFFGGGGGGGGFLVFILIMLVVLFLLSRARRERQ